MNYLYMLFFFIIILAFWAVFSKSTVTSVLCLIGIFLLSGFCFMLLGADFLALMVILVYGGAISILFLFIVMMLNLRLVEVYNVNLYYVPFYFFIIALLLAFYFFLFEYFHNTFNFFLWGLPHPTHSHNAMSLIRHKSSLSVLGVALYNYFFFYVFLGSLILFIAMIGAIYLTINENPKAKGKIVGEKYREPLNYWKAKKKKDT